MLAAYINNVHTDLVGDLPDSLFYELERQLSFRPEGYQFHPLYNRWIKDKNSKKSRRAWDGWTRLIRKNTKRTYFRTGLFSIVKDFFSNKNIQCDYYDCREVHQPTLNLSLSPLYVPRDYQEFIVSDCGPKERGIIRVATGGGKTVIAAGLLNYFRVSPSIFFVTSIDLLTQAKESFESFLLEDGKPIEIGQVGGGVIDIRDINVMTVQTAVRALGKKWDKKYKYDDEDEDDKTPIEQKKDEIVALLRNAKFAAGDEIHHWRNETCQLIFKELGNARKVIGLSGTPYRDQGDDLLISACFGKKIADISASKLIREGWLVKPKIKMVHVRGPKSVYKSWPEIYKDQVSENESYNALAAGIANSYIKKGRTVLVLVKQIKHGKALEALVPGSLFLSGKSAKKRREAGIKLLRAKDITCIISSVIFDEGIDVKCLDTVLMTGQGKSKTRALQRVGRILRPFEGKTDAIAIDFCIHQLFLEDHALEREKMYRTEEEFEIEHIDLKA